MKEIHTDGASSKDGSGGYAWVEMETGLYGHGYVGKTTNQRMEMMAVLRAMQEFPGEPLRIVSDSAYVVNCWRDRWYERWEANGWKGGKKKAVANSDLWRPIIQLWRELPHVMVHVRGHAGDPGNEMADKLAVQAKRERIPYVLSLIERSDQRLSGYASDLG